MAPNCESESIVNPNVNLIIPPWINEGLFENILENDFPNYSKLMNFNPIAAIGAGENYTSRLLRVHIDVQLNDGTVEHTSYVVKTASESESTRRYIDSVYAFPKEKEILQEINPRFEELYSEAGKNVRFGPTCKFVQETPEYMTIVMEDLKTQNFSIVNRQEGLDMVHMKSALKKMAEMHAASAVYAERFGPFSKKLSNSFYLEQYRDTFKQFGSGSSTMFQNVLPKWGGCEKYIPMWPNPDKLFDWFKKATSPDPNEFNVLNHGDCWSNNIMYQHNDKGEITETYLIDFQITCWGTPAQDLHYLITASSTFDSRIKDFDYFLKVYHEHLVENLKLLNYQKPIPNLKDIHIAMIKYSLWSFWTGTSILTAVLAEGNAGDMDNLIGEGEETRKFKEQITTNPRYVKVMKQLLPWWENRGLFDFEF